MAVVLVLSGCSSSQDRLTATVNDFAEALSKGDATAAAALTTDSAAAADTLTKLFGSLGTDLHVEVASVQHNDDGPSTFSLDTTWKFRDGATQWSYTTDGTAVASGDEWTIDWTPATVAPGLDAGPLSYSTLTPDPAARVLDRTGADL
ncbi:NTF2-like N-terminal transpeptidase domain-containing protein, partial [Mycolicibacterium pulveris]